MPFNEPIDTPCSFDKAIRLIAITDSTFRKLHITDTRIEGYQLRKLIAFTPYNQYILDITFECKYISAYDQKLLKLQSILSGSRSVYKLMSCDAGITMDHMIILHHSEISIRGTAREHIKSEKDKGLEGDAMTLATLGLYDKGPRIPLEGQQDEFLAQYKNGKLSAAEVEKLCYRFNYSLYLFVEHIVSYYTGASAAFLLLEKMTYTRTPADAKEFTPWFLGKCGKQFIFPEQILQVIDKAGEAKKWKDAPEAYRAVITAIRKRYDLLALPTRKTSADMRLSVFAPKLPKEEGSKEEDVKGTSKTV